MKGFLKRLEIETVPAAKEIMEKVVVKVLQKTFVLKVHQILPTEKLILHELGTEEIRQLLGAALHIHMYSMKNSRAQELFSDFSLERNVTVTYLNSARFLQLVFETIQARAHTPYEIGVPTPLKRTALFSRNGLSEQRSCKEKAQYRLKHGE